jgi:peptidoglycan/LPS O-acetylase OafA/YrhL
MSRADAGRDEIAPLTGVRGAAAWWVVAFHFARGELRPVPVLGRLVDAGHVAVDLFFVLSGFVLAHRYSVDEVGSRDGRRSFWVRRFARVYPLYAISLAIGLASEWPRSIETLGTPNGAVRLAAQLLLLNSFFHRWMFRHNWAAWSLSVEAVFYALFPFLLPRVLRLSPRRLVALIVLCALATLVAPAVYGAIDPDHLGRPLARTDEILWSWYLKFFPLQRIPEFVAGIATARLASHLRVPRHADVAVVGLLVAVLVSGWIPYAYLQGGALLLVFVALLLVIAKGDGLVARAAAWRPAVALGHASYATYILHVPVFVLWAKFDPKIWESLPRVAAYAGVLLLLSLAGYAYVEEPLRKAIARRTAPRAQRRPAPV